MSLETYLDLRQRRWLSWRSYDSIPCVSGGFSILVNVHSDVDAIRFRDLLNSITLVQHVNKPTHIHGVQDTPLTLSPDNLTLSLLSTLVLRDIFLITML